MESLQRNSTESLPPLSLYDYSIDEIYALLKSNRSRAFEIKKHILEVPGPPGVVTSRILKGFSAALDMHTRAIMAEHDHLDEKTRRSYTARAKNYSRLALELGNKNEEVIDTTRPNWNKRPSIVPALDYKVSLIESLARGEMGYDSEVTDRFVSIVYDEYSTNVLPIESADVLSILQAPSRRRLGRTSIAAAAAIGIGSFATPAVAAEEVAQYGAETVAPQALTEGERVLAVNDSDDKTEGSSASSSVPESTTPFQAVEVSEEMRNDADAQTPTSPESATPAETTSPVSDAPASETAAEQPESAPSAEPEMPEPSASPEASATAEPESVDTPEPEPSEPTATPSAEVAQPEQASSDRSTGQEVTPSPAPEASPFATVEAIDKAALAALETEDIPETEELSPELDTNTDTTPEADLEAPSDESSQEPSSEAAPSPAPEASPFATVEPVDPALLAAQAEVETEALTEPEEEGEEDAEATAQSAASIFATVAKPSEEQLQALRTEPFDDDESTQSRDILDFPTPIPPEPKVTHIPAKPVEKPKEKVEQVRPNIDRVERNGWFWPVDAGIHATPDYDPVNHAGTDYSSERGSPIRAIRDGVVVAAGVDPSMNVSECARLTQAIVPGGLQMLDPQYRILVEHEDNGDGITRSHYVHVTPDGMKVNVGDKVYGGQIIGEMGNTGCSTGKHLHLGMYTANGGWVKPSAILGAEGY